MVKKLILMAAALILGSSLTAEAFLGFGKKQEQQADAMTATAGEFVSVESSLLRAVKYDESSQVLTVILVEGDIYEYKGVPKKVYEKLLSADSKGSYFVAEIRDEYEATKK